MTINHPAGPCYGWDNEEPDHIDERVLSVRTHRARVRHHCNRCGDSIEPGQDYFATALVVDGDFLTDRQHFGGECSLKPGACPTCCGTETVINERMWGDCPDCGGGIQ